MSKNLTQDQREDLARIETERIVEKYKPILNKLERELKADLARDLLDLPDLWTLNDFYRALYDCVLDLQPDIDPDEEHGIK